MRVVSTKFKMVDAFYENEFFALIEKWLQAAGPCKMVAEQLEACAEKIGVHLEAEYCMADTFRIEKESKVFTLFKIAQVFHEQTWIMEIILECSPVGKIVYFHIDCSRDATRFDEAPEMRTDVIRSFVDSGFLKQPKVPITSKPVEPTNELIDWIAGAIREEYDDELPLVLATTYFDTRATEIEEYTLSKKLAGFAYVVVCDNEYTRLLKDRADHATPFNGAVCIYTKGGRPRQFRKRNAYLGAPLDKQIANEVQRFVTSAVDADAPTWEALHAEQVRKEAKESAALAEEALGDNENLDEKLKRAEARIAALVQENMSLTAKCNSLQTALTKSEAVQTIIEPSSIPEFFDGEQHDLLVSILQKALLNCGSKETRQKELITDLLAHNKIIGNGKEMLDVVKSVFADGEELSAKELAELKRVGFEITSDNTHYKLVYKGSKYWFSLAKTSSDKKRSGKNLTSDITKTLSVYKK